MPYWFIAIYCLLTQYTLDGALLQAALRSI